MTDEDAIRVLLATYSEAAYNRDVGAFMSMYEDQVRVFDLWGTWEVDGALSWSEGVTGWFDSLADERVVVKFVDVQVSVAGDLSAVSAMVEYAGESSSGERLRQMTNRLTWLLRQSGDMWRVFHEHTSAPVDPDTGRVILAR